MKTYLQESFSDIANPAQLNAKICSTVMRQGGNIDDYCYQKICLISAQRNCLPENLHDVADVQELVSRISYPSLTRAMAKHMNEFGSLAEATTYARKKYRSLKFQEDMVAENSDLMARRPWILSCRFRLPLLLIMLYLLQTHNHFCRR